MVKHFAIDQNFDLMIFDMLMPGMDGARLLRTLREDHNNLPLAILMISVGAADADMEIFDRVVRKPVRPSELKEVISSLLLKTPRVDVTKTPTNPFNTETFAGMNVLLAEDNLINRKVALHILEKLKIHADVAATGQEAVQMLSEQNYDLIFMDVQMPELDGLQATRIIRLTNDTKQPYIIAMTANAMVQDREDCLNAGMNDFVAKPITIESVRQALEQATGDGTPEGRWAPGRGW